MKLRIVNLWKVESDYLTINILAFSWVENELVFVVWNISFILEY
jgi:hypothetical protein